MNPIPLHNRQTEDWQRALREAIRTLADGVYTNEVWSDGFDDQPIKIVVTVTVRGDEVDIDFTGSSPQAQALS